MKTLKKFSKFLFLLLNKDYGVVERIGTMKESYAITIGEDHFILIGTGEIPRIIKPYTK